MSASWLWVIHRDPDNKYIHREVSSIAMTIKMKLVLVSLRVHACLRWCRLWHCAMKISLLWYELTMNWTSSCTAPQCHPSSAETHSLPGNRTPRAAAAAWSLDVKLSQDRAQDRCFCILCKEQLRGSVFLPSVNSQHLENRIPRALAH